MRRVPRVSSAYFLISGFELFVESVRLGQYVQAIVSKELIMRNSKKVALMLAMSTAITVLPAVAQGDAPGPKGADVSIDLDAAGLAPPPPEAGGPMPFTIPLPPPMAAGMPPLSGDVLFLAEADGPEEDVLMLAMAPPEAGMAIGHGGMRGFSARRWGHGGGMFAGLNLTDTQLEQLFAIKRDSVGKNSAKMGELASASVQVHDAMLQPTIDRAKITALQGRINALKADLANSKLDNKLAMLNVLTAEQRADLRRNMLQRMGGGGKRGWGRGPGGGGHCPPGGCPKDKGK
jgi:Spy/CpxP family protein refolding chaperone